MASIPSATFVRPASKHCVAAGHDLRALSGPRLGSAEAARQRQPGWVGLIRPLHHRVDTLNTAGYARGNLPGRMLGEIGIEGWTERDVFIEGPVPAGLARTYLLEDVT